MSATSSAGALRCCALAILLGALGCAAGTRSSAAAHDTLAPRFARTDAQRARQLAPDLYARAERARAAAAAAEGPAEREDRTVLAELLLDAAIAEAEHIALQRETKAAAARELAAGEQRAQHARERTALAQRAARAREAEATRGAIAQLFGSAEGPAAKAPAAVRARDAALLRERAQLLLAAAVALGLPAAPAAEIEQRIAQAARATPSTAVAAAQRALAAAEQALGQARTARAGSHTGPDTLETAALLELARERGLAAQITPEGVAIALDASGGGSAQPSAQLAALARAHPFGPITIEALAPSTDAAGAQRAARARAERIAALLRAATDPARIQLAPAPVDAAGQIQPRALFSAYRVAAGATSPAAESH